MDRAATEAERTIAVLSPDFLTSLYTRPEWAAAFARDPTGEGGTLLPVWVRECVLRGLLRQIVYVDLVGLEEEKAKGTLLAGVRRGRAKPTTPPGFPKTAQRSVPEQPRFPGAPPAIWNVPHGRNPNFTGREELLRDLHEALTSGQPAALTQAIAGLGGVGKTQLAVEYAYGHAAEYDVVWWVRAEEPATLAANYAELAEDLDLPQKDIQDQRVVVEAVRRWFGQHRGWLLIFDDARDPAALRDYLPQPASGHVLITSRNPNWRGVASPLSVRVWERTESVDFLLKRTGHSDEATADALAEALGDLPLALEQAGAYVETTGTTLAEYLKLFRSRRTELWDDERPPLDYPETVATTWSLAMDRICKESPTSADLLNLCAFLGPDDIPRALLSGGGEYVPRSLADVVTDPLSLNNAIAALRRYSMMDVTEDSLSVHRLVQAVVRDRLYEKDQSMCAETAVRLVNEAFPYDSDDVRTWPESARLLPHALAATGHAEELNVTPKATGRLLNQVGLYLYGRAEIVEAKAVHEKALAIGEAVFGPDHPNVAIDVNNLGMVLHDLGDLEGARINLERALQIFRETLGEDHPKTVTVRENLESLDT